MAIMLKSMCVLILSHCLAFLFPIITNLIEFSLSFPINLTREFYKYFKYQFNLIIPSKENFHFINFLLPIKEVNNVYLNFNSLDYFSFRKNAFNNRFI